MVRLIALYDKPEDEAAFMEHYENVHTPMTHELPGLLDLEVSRITGDAFGGEAPYFLIATMSFANDETFRAAMRSDANKRLGQDLMSFAKGKVKVMVARDHGS